jgi:pimeloyl-ACP methyl ester carboxylesterase
MKVRLSEQAADSYLQVDGGRLRFRDEGRGPPVIFVHGWTLDLEMWEPQIAALAATFRIIRPDRRGFGLSCGGSSLTNDVADLKALCAHLDLPRVAMVGMSQGARVVLEYALRWPMMISCLVADGPPQMHLGGIQDVPYQAFCTLARDHGIDAFRREWAQHPLARLRTRDRDAGDLLARMIARYKGDDLLQMVPEVAPEPLPWRPEKLRVPTLVLTGELDSSSRQAFADELASQLPLAERVHIPAAGHLCNLDNPSAYNRLVGDFLSLNLGITHV